MPSTAPQRSYLILGGAGFIGRNLVQCLLGANDAAVAGPAPPRIRVVDKTLLSMAWMSRTHAAAMAAVEFKQVNLNTMDGVRRAFALNASDTAPWDFVINLAAETKLSLSPEVYDQRVRQLSVDVARVAAESRVGLFIELSTAHVYSSDKKPCCESGSKLAPWTNFAKAKLVAEQEIALVEGLKYVILRPAIVYGPGDLLGITPRLIIGRVYKELKEEMKLLWTKDLRINTVHVRDLSRVIQALCDATLSGGDEQGNGIYGQTYNVVDQSDTQQETVNEVLRAIFDIKTGFYGSVTSNFARLNLTSVTRDVNTKHMEPWSGLLARAGIQNSPLSPYLDQELLYNNSLSVDGTKLKRALPNFEFLHPRINEQLLREMIDGYIEQKLWPPNE